jgi:hypothetical protein
MKVVGLHAKAASRLQNIGQEPLHMWFSRGDKEEYTGTVKQFEPVQALQSNICCIS